MHPADCPNWEYKDHPNYPGDLVARVTRVLVELRSGTIGSCQFAADTRPKHGEVFQNLTPPGYAYFAGHYRGEIFRCLQYYCVGVQGDRSVGLAPTYVINRMRWFEGLVRRGIATLDKASQLPNSQVPPEQKILFTVVFVCRVFELFLQIHPYANGNGHMARFMVWAILGRYGYWPSKWPVEPRPPNPPYINLITQYRAGNRSPLENYILNCIVG